MDTPLGSVLYITLGCAKNELGTAVTKTRPNADQSPTKRLTTPITIRRARIN